MSQAVIAVRNVHKSFGSKLALRDVSFSVEEGSIFGFLGPNGAGKSTTIRCLMDYIRPDSGSVTIFGKDASKHSAELKRSIGYLSADSQLYPGWTGHEHLRLLEGVRGKSQDARQLAQDLELDLGKKAKHLSSGNRQKLALVLALAGQPRLLIMDEPTRALDPLLQNQLYELLRGFAAGGGTVFFSSHNLAEVQRLCSGVVVIRAGEVVAERSMAEIRDLQLRVVEVVAERPIPAELLRLKGVQVIHRQERELSLRVHGDINPLLRVLSRYQLKDVQISHADLEEVFMEFYQ
jgi:ABC-2 type transport system ATP-binding protein